jgi:hypothetical protein
MNGFLLEQVNLRFLEQMGAFLLSSMSQWNPPEIIHNHFLGNFLSGFNFCGRSGETSGTGFRNVAGFMVEKFWIETSGFFEFLGEFMDLRMVR